MAGPVSPLPRLDVAAIAGFLAPLRQELQALRLRAWLQGGAAGVAGTAVAACVFMLPGRSLLAAPGLMLAAMLLLAGAVRITLAMQEVRARFRAAVVPVALRTLAPGLAHEPDGRLHGAGLWQAGLLPGGGHVLTTADRVDGLLDGEPVAIVGATLRAPTHHHRDGPREGQVLFQGLVVRVPLPAPNPTHVHVWPRNGAPALLRAYHEAPAAPEVSFKQPKFARAFEVCAADAAAARGLLGPEAQGIMRGLDAGRGLAFAWEAEHLWLALPLGRPFLQGPWRGTTLDEAAIAAAAGDLVTAIGAARELRRLAAATAPGEVVGRG